MTLQELIARLEREVENRGPDHRIPLGFYSPHSYRGWYDRLAFQPCLDVRIGEMLKDAKSAMDATFPGYKGGKYTMSKYTPVYLAPYGRTGEEIGRVFLELMLGHDGRDVALDW